MAPFDFCSHKETINNLCLPKFPHLDSRTHCIQIELILVCEIFKLPNTKHRTNVSCVRVQCFPAFPSLGHLFSL